ncbi:MAG: FlgD immunoglobulin-like domain containing protein [Candidatus Electryonea clarkiae]|nr:FlgD immunoglobulin-like domain containing protein [Candidatus Electryonea clarkiae]MDP8289337.1 FlgD immunoglobulin-like domain containing protein [Candidatus Electryonea clarkiae]
MKTISCFIRNVIILFAVLIVFPNLLFGGNSRGDELDDVVVVEADESHFIIRSGDYLIEYDMNSTEGYVLFYTDTNPPGALGTKLSPGSDISPTMPDIVDSMTVEEENDEIIVAWYSQNDWAEFVSELHFPMASPGFVYWDVIAEVIENHEIRSSPLPIIHLNRSTLNPEVAQAVRFTDQAPFGVAATIVFETSHINGSVFYLEDLTRWNPWFALMENSPEQTTSGGSSGIGFRRPRTEDRELQSGEFYVLAASYLKLQSGIPQSEEAKAKRYVEGIGTCWRFLQKPQVDLIDWEAIAEQEIEDLFDSDCWVRVNGHDMLRAYVGIDRPNSAEAIAQLDVLVALRNWMEYHESNDQAERLDSLLYASLPYFFNLDHATFVNNYPNQGIGRGDSWYTVQLHLDLARLAKAGDEYAGDILASSLHAVIDLAHNCDYYFPVFFTYDDNQPTTGDEFDVCGAYANLMAMCYEIFDDETYLEEAERSVERLRGNGLDLAYELHITASAAVGCARLYEITGDEEYLLLSFLPLAAVFRNVWMWESDYGYAEDYVTFCGVSAMPWARYAASKEQHEVWRYIFEYLEILRDDLDPVVIDLLEGFLEYGGYAVYSSLPPFLPEETIATADWGINRLDLHLPLEDLRDGWDQLGQIGQEIYGAGAPLTLAAGQAASVHDPRERISGIPDRMVVIESVYPNPANPSQMILIDARSFKPVSNISLGIYNLLGQRVAQINRQDLLPGRHSFYWNGKFNAGFPVASGSYFIRIDEIENTVSKKIVIEK